MIDVSAAPYLSCGCTLWMSEMRREECDVKNERERQAECARDCVSVPTQVLLVQEQEQQLFVEKDNSHWVYRRRRMSLEL